MRVVEAGALLVLLLAAAAAVDVGGVAWGGFDSRLTTSDDAFDVDLAGIWHVRNRNGSVSLNGTVPGQIHTDLMAAGILGVRLNARNIYCIIFSSVFWSLRASQGSERGARLSGRVMRQSVWKPL
jgi:hypothetical protein